MCENIIIRKAKKSDSPLILQFIKKIASYEKMIDEVKTTVEDIETNVFDKRQADVFIAYYKDEAAGFALFFENFSTFEGRAGIYLEDIFVDEKMRGKGIGGLLFNAVAKEALNRGCPRLEWSCLNWNKPSIDFYLHKHAVPMSGWTTYRLKSEYISVAAEEFKGEV